MKKVILILLITFSAIARNLPVKDNDWVYDETHKLTNTNRIMVSLTDLQNKHQGMQTAVVFINSLDGEDIDSYANDLFRNWGIGERGKNNGLLILISVQDRKSRIEVGYGLEEYLTDGWTKGLQTDCFKPNFKRGDFQEGIECALHEIDKRMSRLEAKDVVISKPIEEKAEVKKEIVDVIPQKSEPINWTPILLVIFIICIIVLVGFLLNEYLKDKKKLEEDIKNISDILRVQRSTWQAWQDVFPKRLFENLDKEIKLYFDNFDIPKITKRDVVDLCTEKLKTFSTFEVTTQLIIDYINFQKIIAKQIGIYTNDKFDHPKEAHILEKLKELCKKFDEETTHLNLNSHKATYKTLCNEYDILYHKHVKLQSAKVDIDSIFNVLEKYKDHPNITKLRNDILEVDGILSKNDLNADIDEKVSSVKTLFSNIKEDTVFVNGQQSFIDLYRKTLSNLIHKSDKFIEVRDFYKIDISYRKLAIEELLQKISITITNAYHQISNLRSYQQQIDKHIKSFEKDVSMLETKHTQLTEARSNSSFLWTQTQHIINSFSSKNTHGVSFSSKNSLDDLKSKFSRVGKTSNIEDTISNYVLLKTINTELSSLSSSWDREHRRKLDEEAEEERARLRRIRQQEEEEESRRRSYAAASISSSSDYSSSSSSSDFGGGSSGGGGSDSSW